MRAPMISVSLRNRAVSALLVLFGLASLSASNSKGTEVAIGWAMRGDLDRARRFFLDRYLADSTDAMALNNLGNLALVDGRVTGALRLYEKAELSDSSDGGILLNCGVATALLADTTRAMDLFAKAKELAGGEHAALELLNIDAKWSSDSSGTRGAKPSSRFFKALPSSRALDALTVRRLLTQAKSSVSRDTAQTARASRAADPSITELPLYWKR